MVYFNIKRNWNLTERILVFRTSADATMKRLFHELRGKDIDCLIQSSQIDRYQIEFPYVNFINIYQEGFYDLPSQIMTQISTKSYDQLYITFSGIKGHNFGNVMELVSKVNFKHAFFYNCNGAKIEIPKKNIIKDTLCSLYIKWIGFIYELRSE